MDLRIGVVTDTDEENSQVRVHFPDVDIVSDWIKVIQTSPWMPQIDDLVLCVYDSGFNGDGYVLGALK